MRLPRHLLLSSATAVAAAVALSQQPSNVLPPEMEGVGITENIGRRVDLGLTFIAENGYPVSLGQLRRTVIPCPSGNSFAVKGRSS